MNAVEKKSNSDLSERLNTGGFRFTPQRQQVYDVLLHKRDHPTAEEVFIRAKKQMPEISHATVYNCLDALVQCGLVRLVQLERGATRYLPEHGGALPLLIATCAARYLTWHWRADAAVGPRPRGFQVDHYEIAVHGLCAECAAKRKK